MDRIADYHIVRSIGETSYGGYYLAKTPPRLPIEDELVVVKVTRALASDLSFRLATAELRRFALLKSPRLVTIFDVGRQASVFYCAMEYLPLGSLGRPARPLSREETLRAVADAADAAHSLHENGMAHRDIKPANILLHDEGAKLSDLGLSQFLLPGLIMTLDGSIGIEFTDPAILRGGQASRATDVWALGAVLHRALTGFSLYSDLPPTREPLLLVRAVLTAPPTLHTSLSDQEAEVVSACIAADPGDRLGTAREVAERVRALE